MAWLVRFASVRAIRLRVALALALASSFAFALARNARAAESRDVLIVGRGSPELSRKLRAETVYAGFRPVEPGQGGETTAELRVLSPDHVQVYVRAADGDSHLEQALMASAPERGSFAQQVVEQLRARLVEVGWTLPSTASPPPTPSSTAEGSAVSADASSERAGGQPDQDEPAPRTATTAMMNATAPSEHAGWRPGEREQAPRDVAAPALAAVASSAGRVWLDVGVSSSWAKGGLGPSVHAELGLQLDLGASSYARATSLWPLREAEIEHDEGLATVAWTGFTATLAHALPLPEPWLARAGLGAGLLIVDARGDGREEFRGRRLRLYTGVYLAELSFGREIDSWLTLRASALAGLTAPRPVLRFDDREVASLGRLLGSLTIGVDLTWPDDTEAP